MTQEFSPLPQSLVDDFLGGGYTSRTISRYHSALIKWGDWCQEQDIDPLHASRPDIERFSQCLLDQEHSTNSVRSILAALSSLYHFAFEEGYIHTDPSAHIRRPAKEKYSSGSWLTKAETQQMSSVATAYPDPRVAAIFFLLLYTGIRNSEAINSDVTDLHTLAQGTCLQVTRKTAGGVKRSQRILLHPQAVQAIERMLGTRSEGPLFLSITGKRLSTEGTNRILATLCQASGITKKITAHSLRRTFATLCRDAGVPDRDIMASGGWSSSSMLTYYDMERASIDRHAGIKLAAWLELLTDTIEP